MTQETIQIVLLTVAAIFIGIPMCWFLLKLLGIGMLYTSYKVYRQGRRLQYNIKHPKETHYTKTDDSGNTYYCKKED